MNGERGSDKPGFWELFGGGRKWMTFVTILI